VSPDARFPDPLDRHLRRIHGRSEGPERHARAAPGEDAARRASLRDLLGLTRLAADLADHVVEVEVVAQDVHEGFRREKLVVRTEPTVELPVWCLVPPGPGPFPVVVTPHGHTHWGADQYLGIPFDREDAERIRTKRKDLALQAVRRGYLAVAPTTRGFAPLDHPDLLDHHDQRSCHVQLVHCLLAGRTPLGDRIWDLQRVIDQVTARPDVDRSRIAAVGHSGGGVLAWLLAALDHRVSLAVANEALCPFLGDDLQVRFCACNTVPGLSGWGEIWDVLALVAPRTLVAVSGTGGLYPHDDVDVAARRTEQAFARRGAAGRFTHVYADGPCRVFPEAIWPRVDAVLQSPRASVELCEIDGANVRAFAALAVRDDQRSFVKANALSVAEGLLAPNGWVRGITRADQPVGLVVVRTDEPRPGEHYLWRLMVDAERQGQGIGSEALAQLRRHLAAEHRVDRLHVRFVRAPGDPRGFYERNGFRDTGRTYGRDGELELLVDPPAAATSPGRPA
jgi:dienelactone hydrolase/ribosomal protein S18 acetylase RimI-like enzyme